MSNKPTITFVTSFNEEGYHKYAKNMLESVVKYWSGDTRLIAWYHDFDISTVDAPKCGHIEYRNLNDLEGLHEYREQFGKFNGVVNGQYNWRMDGQKWVHKVFAMSETAFEKAEKEVEAGWLCWLDADTMTTAHFKAEELHEFLPSDVSIVHMGRTATDYSETSFIGFNLNRENSLRFLADLLGAYISGEFLGYREWHDGFIFERILNMYKAHSTKTKNLTPQAKTLDAFSVSPLSHWFMHFKGNKKNNIPAPANDAVSPDVNGPKRYQQLLKLVQHYNAQHIAETGTWNGGRAIQMAEAAFTNHDEVFYYGWDLFEDGTDELNAAEFNGKPNNSIHAVEARLQEYQAKKEKEGKTFHFMLVKGDTNKTLEDTRPERVDLVYIDGGHSYGTTRGDYSHFSELAPVIVFDDYFSEDQNGLKPADEHCGTNKVLEEIIEAHKDDWRIKVLPSQDRVEGGGHTHLALCLTDDALPEIPKEFYRVPIIVTPKDCMPEHNIIDNVNKNMTLLKDDGDWIKFAGIHDSHVFIVSGGTIDWNALRTKIKYMKEDGRDVIVACVKHAYPKMLKHNIPVDYCVVLDPRPLEGLSTHNIKRKELYKKITRRTKFLVASMTDHETVKYLHRKKANIVLWHAFSEAIRDPNSQELKAHPDCDIPEDAVLITGGTCAALRTFAMFHIMGFRHFHFAGFDCSVDEESIEDKNEELDTGQKKYMEVEINDKHFWTTGELLALAQDLEKMFDRTDIEFSVDFMGSGTLAAEVYATSRKAKELDYRKVLP